jgi:hypothetical protein
MSRRFNSTQPTFSVINEIIRKRTFNPILREHGLFPNDVRFLRHTDREAKAEKGTPYKFGLAEPDSKFIRYRSDQTCPVHHRLVNVTSMS